MHERNLQVLVTEMYKISNDLSTPITKDIFPINRTFYNLIQNSQCSRSRINIVSNVIESISNLGPEIWHLEPSSLKELNEFGIFIKAVKQWKPGDCSWRLCVVLVQNVSFLEKNNFKEGVI